MVLEAVKVGDYVRWGGWVLRELMGGVVVRVVVRWCGGVMV